MWQTLSDLSNPLPAERWERPYYGKNKPPRFELPCLSIRLSEGGKSGYEKGSMYPYHDWPWSRTWRSRQQGRKRKLIDRAASGLWTVNINPNINPELTYVITDGVIYITTSYRKVSRENPKTWTSKRPDVLGFLDFPGPPTVTWRFDLLVQWQPEGCKQVLEQLKSKLNA